jgi:ribosome-associated protein
LAKISKPRSTKGLAVFCARVAEEKIAGNIIIMNLKKIEFAPSDFFVICSCDSETQVRAVAEEIEDMAKKIGLARPILEGKEAGQWIILDYFDVVVHVMLTRTREFYKIEKLWSDADFYRLGPDGKEKAVKAEELKEILSGTLVDYSGEAE